MKNIYLPALLLLFLLSSCTRNFYAPALFNNDISYQPKPASFDSAKHSGYITGGFGFNPAVSNKEVITFGEVNIAQAHDLGGVNVAYGAFGYAGAISNNNNNNNTYGPYAFQSKGFWGGGARFSTNLYTKLNNNADFRYLGFEAAYNREDGDFAAYRRLVYGVNGYSSTTKTELVTIGGTSEILWHSTTSTNEQYGLRLFIGKTLGDYSYLDDSEYDSLTNPTSVYVAASYFMQVQKFFGIAELTRGLSPISGIRIKLGYRF